MRKQTLVFSFILSILIILPLLFVNFFTEPFVSKKCVVLMYCTQNLLDKWGKYVLDINMQYAEKNGYTFELIKEPYDDKVTHAWQKIPAMINLLDQGYDCVMYIDSDAIFYDQTIKIEDIVAKYKGDVIACSDEANSAGRYKVNGGAIIAKNTQHAKSILKTWWDKRYEYKEFAFEQWALSDMVQDEQAAWNISVAPESEFNSLYGEVLQYANNTDTLPPQRFVLHFMAMDDEMRERVFSKLHKQIIPLPIAA